ncbi:unnamed protein product [Caenorhabditis angaria]|uniref:Pyruvate dehydrogenase E1 component subunit beta n=1 Tax=Caenorhabditis angaria TaxID=860376 RepID=A0A9P1IQJ1_9PELO|nr:unnamed protein product [Caenorhabditis angaria]
MSLRNLIHFSTKRCRFASTLSVREALNMAMDEELARDKSVLLMGIEVGRYDGCYKVTKDLWKKHGDQQVIDTPITENGFAGVAIGAAFNGMRPICEFMTMNFSMQAIDQIINSAAKTYYMSAGRLNVPIVFRGPNGGTPGVSAQHSQDYSAWYAHCPGLKVLMPYDAEDAKGLLKAAVRDDNPVIFLESEVMYPKEFEVSDEVMSPDFVLPIGKAKIQKSGTDLTIVSYGKAMHTVMEAAKVLKENHNIDVEVVNLRSLRPLDFDTVAKSIRKTGHVISVEESWPVCGIGSEIAARCMEDEKVFGAMKKPMMRVTGCDVPMPYSMPLEAKALPVVDDVTDMVKKVLGKN